MDTDASHEKAQADNRPATLLSLLTTASQARHAPREATQALLTPLSLRSFAAIQFVCIRFASLRLCVRFCLSYVTATIFCARFP
jgi:hypothetical protein